MVDDILKCYNQIRIMDYAATIGMKEEDIGEGEENSGECPITVTTRRLRAGRAACRSEQDLRNRSRVHLKTHTRSPDFPSPIIAGITQGGDNEPVTRTIKCRHSDHPCSSVMDR
jgi:hypothetical protein